MQTVFQDLRFALRQLRRSPGFAVAVVLVLALGIGANAAMFTILEATLFRPLPYSRPQQLLRLSVASNTGQPSYSPLADVLVWQQQARTLDQLSYYDQGQGYLASRDNLQSAEQQVSSTSASANLFATLGVVPALGRTFSAEEQQPGRDNVVVLSDRVWRSQFHADSGIIGQAVRLNADLRTVIGVMPAGFLFPANEAPAQVWTPFAIKPDSLTRTFDGATPSVLVRRNRNVSNPDIEAELNGIQHRLLPLYTDSLMTAELAPTRITAVDYRQSLDTSDGPGLHGHRTALLSLLGAVGVLWLIACANVASLMLARAASRRREMAVRSALGASSWRLARQMLVESLLLSLIGGASGLALAQATLRVFHHRLALEFGTNLALHVDARVLLSLLALSIASALLFSLVPARLSTRVSIEQTLKQDGAQAGMGRSQHRLQAVLVVAELALTLTLLVSCGLLLRTVFALRQVPLGFRTDHVFVIEPHLPGYKYTQVDPNNTVYKPLLDRLRRLPGVEASAITTIAPLATGFDSTFSLYMGAGTKGDKFTSRLTAHMRAAGPELQQVLGFRMVRGRYFNAQDTPSSQLVAVVNQAFARIYEPKGGDISHFSLGMSKDGKRQFKIIGVIDDFHQAGIADPAAPELDLNAAQMQESDGFYQPTLKAHAEIVLRSSRDARSLIPDLERAMRELNPDLTSSSIRTMDQIVDDAMGSQLLAAHLLETLGALALVIALAGLYSLLAYLVTLRTRELGLRLALGAQRSDILGLVLRNATFLMMAGVGLGVGLSLAASRLLAGFLFGVQGHDALTIAVSATLLSVVGIGAALLPAGRAASIEPMEVLRNE